MRSQASNGGIATHRSVLAFDGSDQSFCVHVSPLRGGTHVHKKTDRSRRTPAPTGVSRSHHCWPGSASCGRVAPRQTQADGPLERAGVALRGQGEGASMRIQPLRNAYTTASVRSFTSSFLKIALT